VWIKELSQKRVRKVVSSEQETKKLGGNADLFQNKRLAEKAIRKTMKIQDLQIDGVVGAIHKLMKRKDDRKRVVRGG
jgi:hypothetical protein